MPFFGYKCEKCGLMFRDLMTISKRDNPVDCEDENCDGKANYDIDTDLALSRGSQSKWVTENERWSRSMGVPVKQLAEFRKKYPHHVYNDKGLLLVKGRRHKLKQGKERGFEELNDNISKAWFR